jgi:PAS domain S-box-containing protein
MKMKGDRFPRAAVQVVAGSVALALLTFVCFRLGLDLGTTAFLALIVIVLLSLQGSFLVAAVLSLVAVGCLAYSFSSPILSFEIRDTLEDAVIVAFLTTSAVITYLVSRARKSAADAVSAEASVRKQASLLDLTHDAILVWEFPGTVVYWNRGAEALYGFSKEAAIGRLGHELLHTEHPMATSDFDAALERDGEWAGELTHTTRDGRKIIVESRHVVMRETDGRRLVLETNRDITERKRAEQALEELAGRLIHAQEDERSRIGRELHDHISQTLGVLAIKIDQLRATAEITAGTGAALDELRRDTTEITNDVHRLSHRLHSSTLDYLGLVPALQKLVSEFSERHDIAITFAHASLPAPLPSEVALCLFRVAEESLTNIAKHSKSRSANIHVAGAPDGIHLRVEDAGTGFDPTALGNRAGLGFVSMQERLRVLHGTIHVDSAPSRGTRINAWVPPGMLAGANPP